MRKFEFPPVHSAMEMNGQTSSLWLDWFLRIADVMPIIQEISVTFDPAAVNANSTSEQTVTITGLKTGDTILKVQKPKYTSGLIVTGGLVTAANTVTVQFANITGGSINPAEEVYKFYVLRG
jgi:hypothetical protein